ncbi:MAG: hypothetical protein WCL08_14500, partial [Verrucomicrobiota bacterium]
GREFQLNVIRKDQFDGPVRVDVAGLPTGFHATTPIIVEAGQTFAFGSVYASSDAGAPDPGIAAQSQFIATATIGGKEVRHESPALEEIKLGTPAKIALEVVAKSGDPSPSAAAATKPLELTLYPGETITAVIRANRVNFKERIELGKEDSGRNLPHGVYVDNLGLSGLLIPEGTVEREFFLTAAKWVPEGDRLIFFRGKPDGGQTTPPILLHIRNKKDL